MDDLNIPPDVTQWLRGVFYDCNVRVTEKLSNNPNLPEESLDLTWIEHLSRFSTPVTLESAWTAKIETHFLGGLRHFGRWEIADIGLLLFIRKGGRIVRSKVALLQSKRLYPSNNRVIEEHRMDYEIGFGRIADPEDLARSLTTQTEFEFNDSCRYGALIGGSDQVQAIHDYQKQKEMPVYYQFYNPWSVPFTQRVPLDSYSTFDAPIALGTRIYTADDIHGVLTGDGHRPTLAEVGHKNDGWPLETFVGDLFLGCKEGKRFENINENSIQSLFYRRSGPIAAALSITIEDSSVA